MAKCGSCLTKKGKRYCAPLDKIICPSCCAEKRVKEINCNEDCRYLEGVNFQEKRAEEREFALLMNNVGHGQYDDIFQDPAVALMANEIETFVRNIYIDQAIRITDTTVYEAFKTIYAIHFQGKQIEENQLNEITKQLLGLFNSNSVLWKTNMDEEKVGQVFLRLMVSIKNMSGGRMGEYGYLNYLKNNLGETKGGSDIIIEDKFGTRNAHQLK